MHYLLEKGGGNKPVLVLSNSLGTDLHMWDTVVLELEKKFRILRYDTRGHGGSDAPLGEYKLCDLGNDVLSLLDELGIETSHFCGISLGGLTGQWLGSHAADRITGLVLCNTASKIGNAAGWNARIGMVRESGTRPLAEGVMSRWFSDEFFTEHPDDLKRVVSGFLSTSVNGYCGCCAALRDADLRWEIGRIRAPTLVVSGVEDAVTTRDQGSALASAIAGAGFLELPGRHLAPLENARIFTKAVFAKFAL